MAARIELLIDAKARLGEGIIWDAEQRVLYWVDILAGELHRYDPAVDVDVVYSIGQPVGAVVPRQSGGVMLAVHDGFAHYDLESRTLTLIANPEAHKPDHRFNDGKTDPAGNFWAGTMPFSEDTPTGALYRLDTAMTVRRMIDGVSISNGIVWSGDAATMYYIDSLTREVAAYDYDAATGDIRNRRTAVIIPQAMGYPDGMAIDAEDNLWIAHYGTPYIACWNPQTGDQLERIELPVTNPTACAFGGAQLNQLYITSATKDHDDRQRQQEPLAGGVFRVQLDQITGTTFPPFGG